MPDKKKSGIPLGRDGEARAERFLSDLGYSLLERGCRTRFGEIDLVMRDGETLVFIEVKTRSSSRFGLPEESVTGLKQRKIAKVAAFYIQRNQIGDIPIRFDVISIQGGDIRHIPNAFEAPGYTR